MKHLKNEEIQASFTFNVSLAMADGIAQTGLLYKYKIVRYIVHRLKELTGENEKSYRHYMRMLEWLYRAIKDIPELMLQNHYYTGNAPVA